MSSVQWVLQVSLLLWLSKVLAAGGGATLAKPGCKEKCGDIDIPYPFGIGSAGCYFDEWFEVTCDNSTHHPPKPFLKKMNVEVLNVSLDHGTIRVNNPVLIYENCNRKPSSNETQSWEGGPFSFCDTSTRFTAVGCSALAYISQNDSVIGGCMSFCKKGITGSSCYGLECCQTQIPPGLQSFNVSLSNFDDEDECMYAFMVDHLWFSENVKDPHKVKDMGYVQAVLDWRIYNSTCNASTSNLNTSASVCGSNARCSPDTTLASSLTCRCQQGYKGNPYLPQGCQGQPINRKFKTQFGKFFKILLQNSF